MTYRLDFYGEDDLTAIVQRRRGILGVEVDADAARLHRASAGRGTPRIVNRLLRRVRDHAEVHGDGHDPRATPHRGDEASSTSTSWASTPPTASCSPRSSRSSPRARSASRRWPRSSPRSPRRSRTCTSRSSCASASSTGRRRAASPPSRRAQHLAASASRSRRRAAGPEPRRCPCADGDGRVLIVVGVIAVGSCVGRGSRCSATAGRHHDQGRERHVFIPLGTMLVVSLASVAVAAQPALT